MRTATELVELMNSDNLTDARHLLSNEPIPLDLILRPNAAEENHRCEPWSIEPVQRSLWDVLVGRQEFNKPNRTPPRATAVTKQGDTINALVMVDPAGKLIVERGSVCTEWDLNINAGVVDTIRRQLRLHLGDARVDTIRRQLRVHVRDQL
jgi:hypothetical protein